MSLKNYLNKTHVEVGCDEAGRGCLAGPVYAAAVILPKNFRCKALDDSKKLSKKQRHELRAIIEKKALAFKVGICSPKEIDEINILNASFKAMHKALDKIELPFDQILVDGNRFTLYKNKVHHCIIKGDGKFKSIAAASILAKTYRDEYMEKQHLKFPYYGWDTNKGYPTKKHRDAIAEQGSCKLHRMSFRLLPLAQQGELF